MDSNEKATTWFLPPTGASGEDSFSLKIGGTTYDVTTRFNVDGRSNSSLAPVYTNRDEDEA